MNRFFVNAIIIIFGIFVADLLTGYAGEKIIEKLMRHNYSGQTALLGFNLERATADVVVVGGSTASCHFVPQILSDSISSFTRGDQLTAFNAGAYYQQPSYSYCVLKSIIERGKPKFVIVDIQPQQLGGNTVVEALKPLRPYYRLNSNVKEILDDNESWSNRLWLKSNMFRFNTEIIKLIASFRNPIGADGFDPKDGFVGDINIEPKKDTNELNPVVVSEFERMLSLTKDNSIKLYVVICPRLIYSDKKSKSYKKIIELCNKYSIQLFDLSMDGDFMDGSLFNDELHLNRYGAEKLTKKVSHMIKESLQRDENYN